MDIGDNMIDNIVEIIQMLEADGYLVLDIKQLSEDIVFDLYERGAIKNNKVDCFDVDMFTFDYDIQPLKEALIKAVYEELDNQNIEY